MVHFHPCTAPDRYANQPPAHDLFVIWRRRAIVGRLSLPVVWVRNCRAAPAPVLVFGSFIQLAGRQPDYYHGVFGGFFWGFLARPRCEISFV
jgi:hypothetical protein